MGLIIVNKALKLFTHKKYDLCLEWKILYYPVSTYMKINLNLI